MSLRSFLAILASVSVVVGCSDSPTSPSSNVPDVAALLAEMSLSNISPAAAALVPGARVSLSSSPSLDPGKCSYSANSGYFVCPTVTLNGLTFTRMFKLMDDAGHAQAAPTVGTSALEMKTTVSGTVTSGSAPSTGTFSIAGGSTDTLSAIRAANHILSGVTNDTLKGTVQIGSITAPLDEVDKETTSRLVLPNVKAGQQWPQSGSITLESTSNPGVPLLAETAKVVVTFNGTSTVTITITANGQTTTCHIDLAATQSSGGLTACS